MTQIKLNTNSKPIDTNFDLVALNHPSSKYTAEQKIQACTYYVANGSMKRVSKLTGIPNAVLSNWRNNASWWDETCDEIKQIKNEQLESILTNTLHLAAEEIADRLQNGNEVIVNGEKMRVKVPARELSQLTNTIFEKRALLRGDPSSIRQDQKVDFTQLINEFKNFSKEIQNEKVVSNQ